MCIAFPAPLEANGDQEFNRTMERPFNSEQKFMAVSGTLKSDPSSRERCFMKGSIESVLERCKFYFVSEDSTPALDPSTRALISKKAADAASRGLRVIALAYGFGSVEILDNADVAPLVFVGFQCMLDPPRQGVADAISLLQSGGVQVVMITGDAEQTALSIARQLGLRVQAGNSSVLTGQAIDGMSESQLRERVGSISIFARTRPRHKMAIVEAFRSRGAVVAMTGDGGKTFSIHGKLGNTN